MKFGSKQTRLPTALMLLLSVLLIPSAGAELAGVWTRTARDIDTRSLSKIVDSVTTSEMTDRQKAIALFRYMQNAMVSFDPRPEFWTTDPLKLINVYGWGLCGQQNGAYLSLLKAAGIDGRFVGMNNHTSCEVFYGGGWHWLDLNRGGFRLID